MVLVSNTGNLILVGCKVHTNIVTEVLTNSVVPSDSELNTGILHVTTIDVRWSSTIDRNLRTSNEPVLCGLLIPVEVNTQTAVEQTGIETEVELLRSLPSQVRIRNNVRVSTNGRSSCYRSYNV